jgi:23S rRNA maturation-related 3'-5' exoribonuclease YhaM
MASPYKNVPLASVNPGMSLASVYYLVEVSEKITKTGKPYCDIKLRDKTGMRIAKYWNSFEGFSSCEYVFIKGHVDEYGGAPQIVAKEVINVDESEVSIEDFLMIVENIDDFKSTFEDYASQFINPTIKAIFHAIFTDKFKERFFNAPASEGARYGAIGGSLMQSCRVASAVEQMAYSYELDSEKREMLLAAAFIANAGKVFSYELMDHIPMRTLKGSLYGDFSLAYQQIILAYVRLRQDPKEAIKLAGLEEDEKWKPDDDIILQLTHLVLSSRSGDVNPSDKGERASAILPQTIEAMALSQCFLSDERAASAYDAIKSSELGHSDPNDPFTPYDFATRRRYLKPSFMK